MKKGFSVAVATAACVGMLATCALTIPAAQADDTTVQTPTGLAMAPASNTDTSVVLTWNKPANYSNVARYDVYAGDQYVGSTDMTYFKVTGLKPSTQYEFTVRAVDASGNVKSYPSDAIEVRTMQTPKKYNVRDYGATGNGTTKDTEAIQKAIDACKEKNCEVYLPAGTYLSGALNLHDDMTFYVDSGAQLKPSTDLADYPFTDARHDIEDIYGRNPAYSSLLNVGTMDHSKGATTHNIKIMGAGTIGDEANGLALRKAYDDFTHNGNGGDLPIPSDVYQSGQHVGGGSLISLKNCGNVYMDGVHIRNGMMWTIVPVYSQDITAYNLDLVTSVHNGDGFDPNSSSNVWVLGTTFSTGDDCSAIKSGKDAEGRSIARPSENLYYRGDVFHSGHGGVTIGSEMSGGVRNVFVEDSTIVPVDLGSSAVNQGIRVKVSPKRGGYVKNIQVRDSVINKIGVITNYDRTPASQLDDTPLPDIENFHFSNITAPNWNNNNGKGNVIDISGSDFGEGRVKYLKNFTFDNVKFYNASVNAAQNIAFNNSQLFNGMSLSKTVNVTVDGKQYKDASFPFSDTFDNEAVGTSPSTWKTEQSETGGGMAVTSDGTDSFLRLTDNGMGYERIYRPFSSQNGTVDFSFRFRSPDPSRLHNTDMAFKSSDNRTATKYSFRNSNGKAQLVLRDAKNRDTVIIDDVKANTWYNTGLILDIHNAKISAYDPSTGTNVEGAQNLAFSDKKATNIASFRVNLPNNNTDQVVLDLDNVAASAKADASQPKISAIEVSSDGDRHAIGTKGGTMQLHANVVTNDPNADTGVTWAVTKPDFSGTKAATIDQNGLLNAKENGTVVVSATAKDGSGTMGTWTVVITGQEERTGFEPVEILTAVGVVPTMPAYIYQRNSDGTVVPVAATWQKIDAANVAKEGSFQVKGTAANTEVSATVTVSPVSISSIPTQVIKTTPGVMPKLPIAVTAKLNDGSSKLLPVTWDGIDQTALANQNLDGIEVLGTVSGTDLKAKARVLVLPQIVEGVTPIVVAQDGTGDFRTITEAINSIPSNNAQRRVIFVKAGQYREKIRVDRPYVTIAGQSADSTSIVWNDGPSTLGADGKPLGTYGDYTMQVTGNDFSARDITIETTAGSSVGQAVALDVYADRARFDRCNIRGYQDTLLLRNNTDTSQTDNVPNQTTLRSNRSYFKDCTISGSVDYIFGAGIGVFDNCNIHSMLNGYVTAASTPQNQKYGLVFRNSTLSSEHTYSGKLKTYLGRPWRPYSSMAYLNTTMENHILPEGWNDWGKESNQQTARYSEYKSTGDGAGADKRVPWAKQLTDDEAAQYTLPNIFGLDGGINVDGAWDPDVLAAPTPAPATPITIDATAQTKQGVTLTGSLAPYAQASDDGALTFAATAKPEHGTLTLNADGSYAYVPEPGFHGDDSFGFKASNNGAESNESHMRITVTPVESKPDDNKGGNTGGSTGGNAGDHDHGNQSNAGNTGTTSQPSQNTGASSNANNQPQSKNSVPKNTATAEDHANVGVVAHTGSSIALIVAAAVTLLVAGGVLLTRGRHMHSTRK